MSLELILRERKMRKKAHKLGVSTEQLQMPAVLEVPGSTDPPAPSQAKLDFETAKYHFNRDRLDTSTTKIMSTSHAETEPEEIEVSTTKNPEKSLGAVCTEKPRESMFFQLPSSQQVTRDEQLYEHFKRNTLRRE